MENEIRCEEWTGQKDYYGYIYLTLDQKYNRVYIGQKAELVEKTTWYYGGGKIIRDKINGRGTYFFKKIILGVCFSKEDLAECEIECKLFFDALNPLYGYNVILEERGWDVVNEHPNKEEIIKKIVKTRREKDNYRKKGEITMSEGSKKKISIINTGKKRTEEHKKKMSEKAQGKNNPMYGRPLYSVWLEKYGKEEADKREKQRKIKEKETKSKNKKFIILKLESEKIKELYLKGYTTKEISEKLNISKKKVYRRLKDDLKFPTNFFSGKGKKEIKEFIKHYKETNNLE